MPLIRIQLQGPFSHRIRGFFGAGINKALGSGAAKIFPAAAQPAPFALRTNVPSYYHTQPALNLALKRRWGSGCPNLPRPPDRRRRAVNCPEELRRSMLDSASVSTVILLAAASALLLAAMLYPSSLLRWLQRKRYQYEVTFSLYMLTPTEKFIFSAFTPFESHSTRLPPSSLTRHTNC